VTAEPLLEREGELSRLDAAIAAAAGGAGGVVLVEGDPGVGRTSLLASAAARTAAARFEVLEARGGALEGAEGFGVVRRFFERPVGRAEAADREALLGGAAALAAGPLGLGGLAPGPLDPTQARHGLYWLLANLAERRPVALLLDDAQWADRASLEWLLYASRRIDRLPVLIVVALATGSPAPADLLDALAHEPLAVRLRLAPLGEAGTAALLAAGFGGAEVDDDFARACHHWTGGNPHFVAETAAALAAEGTAPVGPAIERLRSLAPERIATMTKLRLGRLPADAGRLAAALAILGGEAERAHAAALAELEEPTAVAAADALAAARLIAAGPTVAAEVLRPTGATAGPLAAAGPTAPVPASVGPADSRLRFAEPLVERVVYEGLGPARRAADHARAARLLDAAGADPDAIAAQLLRAEPAANPWVADRLRDAAGAELARGSAAAAAAFLRRALAEPPPAAEVAGTRTMLGLAEAVAGEPGGLDSLRAGVAESAAGPARGAAMLLLARFLVYAGRGGEVVERAEPVLAELDGTDPALRVRLEAALVTAARSAAGLREVADAHLAEVRPLADADTPEGRVVAVQCAYAAAAAGAPVAEAVGFCRAALAGGKLLDEEPLSPDVYLVPISMLAICDELEEAAAAFGEVLDRARAGGSPLAYAAAAAISSWTAILRGRLGDGELLARDALRISGDAAGLEALRGFATVHLALALIERGEPAEALDLLATDVDPAHTWAREALFARGRAELAAHRPAAALQHLEACGALSASFGIVNPAFLPWRSQAALALRELGRGEEAAREAAAEVELGRRFGAARPLGVALRVAGLVAGGEEGLDLLRESAAILAESPARLERARSLVALGAALRRAGGRAEARDPLVTGLGLAEECGAAAIATSAREELAAGGVRVRAGGRWDADALTASELRTCRMAAAGMSNPAIAQSLFVTRATVQSHLHAAYRKLGIASRTELPAALEGYADGAPA
jgi:DNA-binding CsgD family transcriptional regulator/predicted negative regulator of RcsB-dependent stress response